jgi:hypothetical protein|nr:MAG TPA: Sialidase, N-terminal domain [Caudoviricetes sp.]
MTLEEALEASVVEPVNDIFEIDPETRVITVPASEKLFGVANDGNSERKHFRCPKIVGDNIDLSTMHLYINYQNANGQKYPYLVEDIRTDGDYITFSWLIGPDVVAYKGQIKFIVCAKKGDGTIPEWNTTLAEGTVLEGLEATDEVVARNPDIIEQILARLDSVTEIPQEKVTEAVSEYMKENPINVPKKLSDLEEDATHRTVTDTEKQSWNNTSGIGLPDTAKKLLIAILKNAVYTVNQKTNIEALENALSTQNTPTDAWPIVQNLTYVTSTNTAFNVKKGESYTTTIVPNKNYTINSVTVVMGGVDITNTAYNNGVITINSVTGNVTITAIAKKNSGALLPSDGLLANFDFRNKEMTSYNLSGWGNVYKCDDETGNYFTFGGSAKTASQGGIGQYLFRDVRKKDNESKSVDLGTDFTIAMYSTEVPNILNSTKKSNVSTGKIILAPRYINTSASEVTVKEYTPDITRNEYMSLTITVSSKLMKIYVDGTLQKTYNGDEFSDFSKWKSTQVQPATVYNIGTIAAAVMYNKALSDNDVTELHAYFKALEVE